MTEKPRGRLTEFGFGVAVAANGGLRAEVRRAARAKLAHDLATASEPVTALGGVRERKLPRTRTAPACIYFYVPVVRC